MQVFIKVGEIAAEEKESKYRTENGGSAAVNIGGVNGNVSSVNLLTDAADSEQRSSGIGLFLQQLRAMLVKKWTYVIRNWLLLSSQVIIPIVFLIITLVLLHSLPGTRHHQSAKMKSIEK